VIGHQSILTFEVREAAKAHARAEYPKESCGIVFRGAYVPCKNIASDPEKDFEISPHVYQQFVARGGVEAVLHSHPGGPLFPTQSDMESQLLTAVPWGIIPIIIEDDECRIGDPIMWGDQLPRLPIIGRSFVPGITDCYSMIRDIFFAGREGLKAQNITDVWPFDSIQLPEVPRDADWFAQGQDLYIDGLAKHGFREIKQHEARAGDGFLMKWKSDRFNHGGVLVANDLLAHHLPDRLSRREAAGIWGRQAGMWVRYEGPGANA
jgi:proteasome lid subunit RPN8/RPN11